MTIACTLGCLRGLVQAQKRTSQVGEWLISLLDILFNEGTLEKIHISANKVIEERGVGPIYPEKDHDVSNIGTPVFDLVLKYLLLIFTGDKGVFWEEFVFSKPVVDLNVCDVFPVVKGLASKGFSYASSTNWPIDEPNEYVQVYKLQAMTLVLLSILIYLES